MGNLSCFIGFFLTVHKLCQAVGQNFFLLINSVVCPAVHLLNFLNRKEGQHTNTLHHIRVVHIAPVLVKFKGRSLIRIKPYGAFSGLTHFLTLAVKE